MGLTIGDKKSIIQFCKELNIPYETGWHNFTKSVSLPESLVLDIQTEEQAVALAKKILKLNSKNSLDNTITYRAIAAGESADHKDPRYDCQSYSMTPIMQADVLIRLRGKPFHDIQLIDKENHIIKVGPSVQMGELDTRLYKDFERVLPTSTLIPWVTIGGSATATHGTGRDQPSIAGLIQSLRILRPDGKIVTLDKKHKDFETIRAAHLGLFGIVLDMEVRSMPAKKLEITIESTNIFHYKELIKQGLYKDNEYVNVIDFMDGEKDEGAEDADIDLIIMKGNSVPLSTPDKGNCTSLEHFIQRLTIFLQESLNINALLKKHPKLGALFKRYVIAPLQVLGQNKTVVVPWPIGAHNQVAFPHDLDDEDDIFPVSDDCHELLDALDHLVATSNKFVKNKLTPVPALYAMYFRYFKGTNGGLSTSAHGKDQHVIGFDMTSARNVPGFSEFKKEIRDYLIKKYGAKPHHGKTVPHDLNYAEIYGEGYYDFMRALRKWAADCGMDLNTWPHMNPFFRHHLGVGVTLLGRVENAVITEKLSTTSDISTQTAAQSLLDVLDAQEEKIKDEPAVKNLRENLEVLATVKEVVLSGNPNTQFQPRDRTVAEELRNIPVEQVKEKNGCCVIL